MSVCPFTAPLLPSSSFCNALMAFYDKILHKKNLGEEVLPWLMTFLGRGRVSVHHGRGRHDGVLGNGSTWWRLFTHGKPRTRQDPETGYNLQGLPLVSHFLQLGPMS